MSIASEGRRTAGGLAPKPEAGTLRHRPKLRQRPGRATAVVDEAVTLCEHRPQGTAASRVAAAASEKMPVQFEALISRPATDWIGRAFIGYRRENTATWSPATGTGCCITSHSTPSLHGGVVSEPM